MNFKYIFHSCEVDSRDGFLLWADQAGTAFTAAARNRYSVILLRKVHFSWPKKFCARSRKVFPLNVKLQFCWICPRIRGKEFLCKIESSLSFGKNFPSKADEQFSIDFNFCDFEPFRVFELCKILQSFILTLLLMQILLGTLSIENPFLSESEYVKIQKEICILSECH